MKYFHYETEIGYLTIAESDEKITEVGFGKKAYPDSMREETPLIKESIRQIIEYLEGNREKFELPIQLTGTEFQRNVWNSLKKIPYGETRSYKEVALMAGNQKAYRAVGNANNKNPVAIIVP